MTYNGSDRKDIRRAEKTAKAADAKRRAYVRTIMSTVDGREWVHNLLSQCNVFHTPFVRGAPDLTSFQCGQQNFGLQLFADVVSHPNEYVLMMYEASQKEASDDRHDGNDRSTALSTSGEHPGSPDPGRDVEGSDPDDYPADDPGAYH